MFLYSKLLRASKLIFPTTNNRILTNMNKSLVTIAAAAAAASIADDDDDDNNNNNMAVIEEEEEEEEEEEKEKEKEEKEEKEKEIEDKIKTVPPKKKKKRRSKFSRHQLKRKQSKNTPRHVVGVIREIRSGSNNKSPHSTTVNDTITSLRNQIHCTNIIVQQAKDDKEELIRLHKRENVLIYLFVMFKKQQKEK